MARRLLTVEVTEARGLLAVESNGTSDPYAAVCVELENKPVDDGVKKTNAVRGTLAPKWKPQVMKFGNSFDLNSAGPYLRVKVFDSNMFGADKELGEVDIRWTEEGLDTAQWYPLKPFGGLRSGANLGEIFIKVKIDPVAAEKRGSVFRAGAAAAGGVQRHGSALDTGITGEVEQSDELPEHKDEPPNLLRLKLVKAEGLRIADKDLFGGGGTSDPLVKLFMGDQEAKSKVVKKTLNPTWDEQFDFICLETSESLSLIVEDEDVTTNDFLGALNLHMDELKHKKKIVRSFDLTNQDGSKSTKGDLGRIFLELQWFYDPASEGKDPKAKKGFFHGFRSSLATSVGLEDKDDDTEDEGDDDMDPEKKMSAEDKKAADKAAEEERAKLKEQLMDIEIKSGDYMMYVHIIEARDLKGEDLQGTSDPVVYVTAFGQRFATEVKQDCLSAVWDETFVISLRNLDKEEFEQGVIRLAVMDADGGKLGVLKSDLIGAFSFDTSFVYSQLNHEIHRKWLALIDDENVDDTGVQGYLKISIAIVGPGDKLKVHDEEADRAKDREEETKAGGFDKLVFMPASLDRKQKWLVSTIWKGEYLPVMDETLIGKGGGDYYTQLSVGGGKPVRTKRITMKGSRSALNPAWRTELWLPITLPAASGTIKFSVMDFDVLGQDEVVSSFTNKIRDITNCNNKLGPRWIPLYGPPEKVPDGQNIRAIGRKMGGDNIDYKQLYTNFPDKGSMYRGRILVTQEIRSELPTEHADERLGWKRKVKQLNPNLEPAAKKYQLTCFVTSGTEIPKFPNLLLGGTKNLPMWVRVSIGKYEVFTEARDNERGVCIWNQMLMEEVTLPVDPAQQPDVLIQLMRDTGNNALPVCFTRFKAADLIADKFKTGPKWVNLGEDKVLDVLDDGEFPGSLLMRLGLGLVSTYANVADAWEKERQAVTGKKVPYEVRLHIYQCRDFPAHDDNGLMDPYLKVTLLGHTMSTEDHKDEAGKCSLRRRATTDPNYYYTRRWQVELLPAELKDWFPQVSIKVFDWDFLGVHAFAGQTFVPLHEASIEATAAIQPPPTPRWLPIFREAPGDTSGEILLSWQIIEKNTKTEELAAPPSLLPELREAWVEGLVIGIRGMMPFRMLPMQLPYAEFELDLGKDEKTVVRTEASHHPTGSDANFLQRFKVKTQLPVQEIFAPRIRVRVHDTRLGGFLKPLVGAGQIETLSKLPWSKSYVPPTCNVVDTANLIAEAQAEAEKMVADAAAAGAEETKGGEGGATTGGWMATQPAAPVAPALAALAASSSAVGVVKKSSASSGLVRTSTATQLSRTATAAKMLPFSAGVGVAVLDSGAQQATEASMLAAVTTTGQGQPRGATGAAAGVFAMLGEQEGKEDVGLGVMPALLKAMGDGAPPVDSAEANRRITALTQQLSTRPGDAAADSGAGVGSMVGLDQGPPPEDEDEGPPKYMIGRQKLEADLEAELKTTPFQTCELWRGQGDDSRVVGKLKYIVRVTVDDPDDVPLFVHPSEFDNAGGLKAAQEKNKFILTELLKPKGYKLRLYVLQALNLTPMDLGIGGRPGKSDPYLLVKLGTEEFNDSKNYIEDVTEADIYHCVELNAELPGASQLDVAVMDYDDFGSHDVIGRTPIDLEDRWFDQRWQALGKENRVENIDNGKLRWQTKPLERRSLYVPTSNAPQGVLECWVDILSLGDANAFPPDNVAQPPVAEFEVRIVIWKCKDVVAMDTLENMNDLFVRAWVEGCDPLDTDTHWRAKKGKGSFNWRLKFKVSLGPRTRTMKFPYLTIQLWDKDILKWNDCIAEGQLDLGLALKKAYKKKTEVVKMFNEVTPEQLAKAKKEAEMRANDAANAAKDGPGPGEDAAPLLGDNASGNGAPTDPSAAAAAYNMGRMASPPEASPASLEAGTATGVSAAALPPRPRPPSTRSAAPALGEVSPGDPMARPAGNLSAPLVPAGSRSDEMEASRTNPGGAEMSVSGIAPLVPTSPRAAAAAGGAGAVRSTSSQARGAAALGGTPKGSSLGGQAPGQQSTGDRLSNWLFVQDPPPRRSISPRSGAAVAMTPAPAPSAGSSGGNGNAPLSPPSATGAVAVGGAGSPPAAAAAAAAGPSGAAGAAAPRAAGSKPAGKRATKVKANAKKDPNAKTETELFRENERRKALGLPEVTEADYKKADDGDDDAKEFIRSVKEMTGLFDDDPIESHWLKMERTDRKTGKKEPMGKCCLGIQIWPIEKAELQPAGFGRADPNNTPFCPPPTGRLKFSFNPFVMGMELFGPKICCYIMCVCICILVIVLLIFCQPLFNLAIALAFN